MSTKEQRREDSILRIMHTCEHFTGIQNSTCKAGVNIREIVGGEDFGWATRMPCMLSHALRCEVQCALRNLPTRAKAEEEENEHEALMVRFGLAHRAAKEDAKSKGFGRGNGGRSELSCPTECGGMLRYSVASVNGHMHARCSTKGCVSWME